MGPQCFHKSSRPEGALLSSGAGLEQDRLGPAPRAREGQERQGSGVRPLDAEPAELRLELEGRDTPTSQRLWGALAWLLSQDPGPGLGMTVVTACQVSLSKDYSLGFITHSRPRPYSLGAVLTLCALEPPGSH